jgi:hypothetical protein
MTHHEATAILNRVREGQQFSYFVITRALELTGDYEEQQYEKLENKDDKDIAK